VTSKQPAAAAAAKATCCCCCWLCSTHVLHDACLCLQRPLAVRNPPAAETATGHNGSSMAVQCYTHHQHTSCDQATGHWPPSNMADSVHMLLIAHGLGNCRQCTRGTLHTIELHVHQRQLHIVMLCYYCYIASPDVLLSLQHWDEGRTHHLQLTQTSPAAHSSSSSIWSPHEGQWRPSCEGQL
jgi:hypothetical protein